MSFVRKIWIKDEIIPAEDMNRIEQAIDDLDKALASAATGFVHISVDGTTLVIETGLTDASEVSY